MQDGDRKPHRSPSNLCWHTGQWCPANTSIGCDGELELTPPICKLAAPDFLPNSGGVNAVAPLLVPAVKQCNSRIAINRNNSFGFGQDHLSVTKKTTDG